jgi:hypothetical protein
VRYRRWISGLGRLIHFQTRDCTLAASSAYSIWPAPLIETLCRSYKAHTKGTYGDTLKTSFQFDAEIEPASFEDALDKTNASFVKVVYDRTARYSGLWSYWISSTWFGTWLTMVSPSVVKTQPANLH